MPTANYCGTRTVERPAAARVSTTRNTAGALSEAKSLAARAARPGAQREEVAELAGGSVARRRIEGCEMFILQMFGVSRLCRAAEVARPATSNATSTNSTPEARPPSTTSTGSVRRKHGRHGDLGSFGPAFRLGRQAERDVDHLDAALLAEATSR
jgi:hypothetical protein